MVVVLLGFMGAGKSTVAAQLQKPVYDMDQIIEQRIGMTIADYFALKGEAAFRLLETEVLEELLSLTEDAVISTGGGVVLSEQNRTLLATNRQKNVYLAAPFSVLYQRIKADQQNQRPIFLQHSEEEVYAIYQQRVSLYQAIADIVIETEQKSPEELARMIECL